LAGTLCVRQFFLVSFVQLKKTFMKIAAIASIVLMLLTTPASGQKQLVLLRKESVVLRLYPGDDIVLRLKKSKSVKRTYVNNLLEGAVVTHNDTIPFQKIDRIYFRHPLRLNKIGGLLLFGGMSLLLIDQVNNSFIQGNEAGFDQGFTKAVLITAGVGLPLFLIRKKSEKVNFRHRLLMVSKGSVFYRPDTRRGVSPYLEN
jgi:hypothetical protein